MTNDIFEEKKITPAPEKLPEKVGDILKKKRLELGISVEQITKDLKMRPALLHIIEDSSYTKAPDMASLSGLVKTYAYYLKLDGQSLAQKIREEAEGEKKEVQIHFPEMLPSDFRLSKWILTIAFIFVIIFMIKQFWQDKQSEETHISPAEVISETSSQEIEPVTESVPVINEKNKKFLQAEQKIITQTLSAVTIDSDSSNMSVLDQNKTTNNVDTQKQVQKTEQKTTDKTLIIVAEKGDSWIEIHKEGQKTPIYMALLKRGKSYQVPSFKEDKEKYSLKTGNASVLVIKQDGKNIHSFEANQHVIKDFSLNRIAKIKENSAE